jgi:8-oxo-dGTP pyrophosphatase MutT (NUDIX family)
MSKMAFEKIKPDGFNDGEVCVIEFEYNSERFYLFTIDNKPYIQNVQGCKEPSDTVLGDCIIRELMEEISLVTTKDKLKEIGYWSFLEENTIVDKSVSSRSVVFYMYTDYENIKHLFPNGIKNNAINIVDAKDIQIKLDETLFIIAVPKTMMNDAPMIINNKNFNGHHRECIHRLNNNSKCDIHYLYSFFIEQ